MQSRATHRGGYLNRDWDTHHSLLDFVVLDDTGEIAGPLHAD